MFNGSNCDWKSQLSGVLAECLNPRVGFPKKKMSLNLVQRIVYTNQRYVNEQRASLYRN